MVTLANLYALSDWSIQQLAIGLAMLPLLVGLAWYVSHPLIVAGCMPLHLHQTFASQTIES